MSMNEEDESGSGEQVTKHVEYGWVSIEHGSDYKGPVDVLSNGYVHLIDREEMYPPQKISHISIADKQSVEDIPISIEEVEWPITVAGFFLTVTPIVLFYYFSGFFLPLTASLTNMATSIVFSFMFLSGAVLINVGVDPNARKEFDEMV